MKLGMKGAQRLRTGELTMLYERAVFESPGPTPGLIADMANYQTRQPSTCRALVIDDRPLIRTALVALLKGFCVHVSGVPLDRDAVDEHASAPGCLVLVIPFQVLARSGRDLMSLVGDRSGDTRVIVVTERRCIDILAIERYCIPHGMISVESETNALGECVAAVLRGARYMDTVGRAPRQGFGQRSRLTAREQAVLDRVAMGQCNKRIARDLGITEDTVKSHMKHLMGKLGARSRTDAVCTAMRTGLLVV